MVRVLVDVICEHGHEQIDVWRIDGKYPTCQECGQPTIRLYRGQSAGVIGDECDVWIRHGICHADGSPRHYTSRQEIQRAAQAKGLINNVTHVTPAGSDKAKDRHGRTTTQRFI